MKKEILTIVIGIILLLFIQQTGATTTYTWSNITTKYNSGDYITGSARFNITNEPVNLTIRSNLNGSITLEELIRKNNLKNGVEYRCSTLNCSSQYELETVFSNTYLRNNQSKNIGFKLTGDNIQIEEVSFELVGNSTSSCRNQLGIDFFDERAHTIENTKYSNQTCGLQVTGCFNTALANSAYALANISSTPYCIKQKLSAAPAYKLGATLEAPTAITNEILKMTIYPSDLSSSALGECILPNATLNSPIVSCISDYASANEQEYYICISSNKITSANRIKTEQTGEVCGVKLPIQTNTKIDFNLFAQSMGYAPPTFDVDVDLFNLFYFRENFTQLSKNYIQQKYGGDCINNNCILPLTIRGEEQGVSIVHPIITYTSDGIPFSDNNIYSIKKENSKISASNILINLALAKFNIFYGVQPTSFKMYWDNQTNPLIDIPINVTLGDFFEVTPQFAYIGIPTYFTIQPTKNITEVVWKFEDNSMQYRGTSTVHTFERAGNYNLFVEITTLNGKKSSRNLIIEVGEPKESAKKLISRAYDKISDLNTEISLLPAWSAGIIKTKLNLSTLNSSLGNIAVKIEYASNTSEFIDAINEIKSLNIPSSLKITKTGAYPLALLYKNADINSLLQLTNNETKVDEDSKNYMISWLNENYNAQIKMETLSLIFEDSNEALSTIIGIDLSPKANAQANEDTKYLVINYPYGAIQFKENYGQKEISGSSYVSSSKDNMKIEFIVPGEVNFETFGAYYSPSLDKINNAVVIEPADSSAGKIRTKLIMGFLALVLFVCSLAFIIQYWYKKKYEKYLFKNGDELYNIMTFIYNSKKSNLDVETINKKLKLSGWTGEQIKYASDKLSGKVLGIFGIPIFKDMQEKSVANEIQKRKIEGGRKVY